MPNKIKILFFLKVYDIYKKSIYKNMNYNRNVVEDALFQIRNLEETLQENAKGILQSTMSEEIKQLVKESLREQDDDEVEMPVDDTDDEDDDLDYEDGDLDDEDDDLDDEDDDLDDEDVNMPVDDTDDDETIDMTGASDAEVLRVFKAMDDEDGIVIKKEGNNINLKDGDNEYMIRLGESNRSYSNIYEDDNMGYDGLAEDDDAEMYLDGAEMEEMMDNEDDQVVYEIEMGDKESYLNDMMEDNDEFSDDDAEMEEMMDNEDDQVVYEIEMGDKESYLNDMMEDNDEFSDDDAEMYLGGAEMEEMMDNEDDNNFDRMMEAVKKSLKSKGAENRRGPKFSYDKKPNMGGGFDSKKKEAFGKGTKAMGTGKARFEYKDEKGKNTMVNRTERKEGTIMKKDVVRQETKEASRTYGNGSKDGSRGLRKAITPNRNLVFGKGGVKSESVENEIDLLKDKNQEYRKALDIFRTKLNEVAVFNSNLAYATRLFTEQSTTKQEKINILKRFDNVEALKESKNLYRTIKNELSSGNYSSDQKINESIERTVNRSVETGSSANLIESKTYENPQFLRMKDLMTKIK